MKANLFRLMLVVALGAPLAACGDDSNGTGETDAAGDVGGGDAGGDDTGGDDTGGEDTIEDTGGEDTIEDTGGEDTTEDTIEDGGDDTTDDTTDDTVEDVAPDGSGEDAGDDTDGGVVCDDDEAEADDGDDDVDNATSIADGETIADRVAAPGDADVFGTPVIQVGESIAATVTFGADAGTVTGRVLDSSGDELSTATSDTGTLELSYEPEGFAAGNFYFEVTSEDCVTYSIEATYTGGETVECTDDDAEADGGDDSIGTATSLGADAVIPNRTANGGDFDFYATPRLGLLGEDGNVNVYATITYTGDGDVTGSILEADGAELVTTTGSEGTLELYFVPDSGFSGGNYYFAITSDGCNDYTIEAKYDEDPLASE